VSETTKPTLSDAIDVNVHLSRWPFRRLPLDEPGPLVERLKSLGVKQAWAGSFDALLHRDIAAVNARLVDDCKTHGAGFLLPFGAINPTLPDWQEDLRRCREVFKMPGFRLYPNYHGYKLDDPVFARVLNLATSAGLLVQVAASMEDERNQLPLVHVPPVDVAPLPSVLEKVPKAHLVLLGALRAPRGEPLMTLGKIDQISFDIATLETTGGIATLLQHLPPERLLFGSHAPFFYPESAAMKLTESPLTQDVSAAIRTGNATRLLHRT
jgi:predicted TIM-barrel fold metal-dependent hydrolase